MANWSRDHQAEPTPEAWAAELVKRLEKTRPSAPAAPAAEVDALIAVHTLVARGASAGTRLA